ncbi:MAG: hypothetical protein IBX43_00790 [Campylobacterales bacterium]|nr:hypothetical protein [Campylobacterales bacterium]
MMKTLFALVIVLLLGGCSTLELSRATALPDNNQIKTITVFALDNYTDTPQAGMRASNLIQGALLSRHYRVLNGIDKNIMSLEQQLQIARENGSDYILNGGVSEWRYKTGIDGEPAVSLQCKIIHVDSQKVVWSTTASSNDWGNASIGTTAQSMIESMFEAR